ncbi:MAG TPA: MauE/DoxX family redox-associated membrane protein [Actinophytocola sp.]|uniref:MauE/DoxX family redox-associated membrane protein n=1 Tax=Actinophytocola sp. TaxID=1872138 RepID=UPI002DBEEB79|nr:MauE/DoxX family redox-associated membrane protein [Actinophytocola sp.]HEU5473297.1 MauE/DoxX family redox-associated membrane protein [Actinophytocola sp.]
MAGFAGGAGLLLAGLLIVAGGLKLMRPKAFAHAVYRLLPKHLNRRELFAAVAAPVVGGVELLVGAGLLATAARPVVAVVGVSAALYLGFVVVVGIAIRKGTSCGCFASFSDRTASGAEFGRALALAVLAVALFVLELTSPAGTWWSTEAVLWSLGLAAAVVVITAFSGRIWPSGWLLLGRIESRLAGVDLPASAPIDAHERTALITAVRAAPSVRAFEEWLGERAATLDWRRSEVRTSAATPPGGPRVPCTLVSPRTRDAVSVTVSVPSAHASAAVVIAVVDGRPVSAIGGRVMTGPEPARR